jgi:hypothetical protein
MADKRSIEASIPQAAVGLKLFRHNQQDELVACKAVRFEGGRPAVGTALRRAAISGRVDVGGEIKNHFADILDADGSMIETVALDARSYKALKTRWARCRTEPAHGGEQP